VERRDEYVDEIEPYYEMELKKKGQRVEVLERELNEKHVFLTAIAEIQMEIG